MSYQVNISRPKTDAVFIELKVDSTEFLMDLLDMVLTDFNTIGIDLNGG